MLSYLLQVIVCSSVLYGYYYLFFRNRKFHQYNRYYLLIATILSILIPFFSIPIYFNNEQVVPPSLLKTLSAVPEMFSESFESTAIAGSGNYHANKIDFPGILLITYFLISVYFFIQFFLSLVRISRMYFKNPKKWVGRIAVVTTNDPATPFTFFNWFFWNDSIRQNSEEGQQIFEHELIHIQQKHSWDVIFLEFVSILFWGNPFFHFIKKETLVIHEFLADKFAARDNKKKYAELLLMQLLGTSNTRLVSSFSCRQIKRRITMLTNSKATRYHFIQKMMVLPLTAIVVSLFAFKYKDAGGLGVVARKSVTIVIDAGHGGTDEGAWSSNKNVSEAVLALEIAKQIQTLAKDYNINVIMTRDDGSFPGNVANKSDGIKKRVEVTNNAEVSAFISIHLGSSTKPGTNGFAAYISNQTKRLGDKVLASVVLQEIESIGITNLGLKQSKEKIFVLDKASCPAIILECGFISNVTDLAFVKNKKNQIRIANSVLRAIQKYKSN